jgi:hypothetical protein
VQQFSSTEVMFVRQVVLNDISSESGITSMKEALRESRSSTYPFTCWTVYDGAWSFEDHLSSSTLIRRFYESEQLGVQEMRHLNDLSTYVVGGKLDIVLCM